MKAKISDIKRFAVHDGDGIRTTVFFKGCPLKCVWCHNPEGIGYKAQVAYYANKCINCGECAEVCKNIAHKLDENGHSYDREECIACGACIEKCLGSALMLYGKEYTSDELMPLLLEDKDFYKTSNGGITLSGGECLMQADFCAELLKKLKDEGIHTAVDTCGYVPRESIDKVLPYTDIFLYDIKAYDEDVHIRCTGKSNKLILDNLNYINETGKPVEIRIPYVPGYNSDQMNKIAEFLSRLNCITKVKVLPYHSYAASKYASLGMENTLPSDIPTDKEIEEAQKIFEKIKMREYMKNRKTLTALLLLATMLFGSCGANAEPTETTTSAPVESTEAVIEETTLFEPDSLPDDLDFNGSTVNLFVADYSSAYAEDIISEEETGNRLKDAVYNVTASVEERLNVKLKYSSEAFTWGQMSSFQSKVIASLLAGDEKMQILYSGFNFAAQMLEGEYFINLADTKYIDLEKPWYNQAILDTIIGDNVYFVGGKFAIANVKNAYSIYFNADMYSDMGKDEDLYGIVYDGAWTLDKLESLIKGTYSDINGDGTADPYDRYGMTFGDFNKILGFMNAFEVKMFEKKDNKFEYTFNSERAVSAVERLTELIHQNENTLPPKTNNDDFADFQISSGGGNYINRAFMENRALFTCALIADAAAIIPNIDFNFGILPYPKWNEEQDEYRSQLQRNCFMLIPSIVKDVDMVSAVMEAITSESYRTLLPEYCEITLKTRYSPDDNVSRMFDLIGSGIVYDPGEIYSLLLGTPSAVYKDAIFKNTPNWASTSESLRSEYEAKIAQLYE